MTHKEKQLFIVIFALAAVAYIIIGLLLVVTQ